MPNRKEHNDIALSEFKEIGSELLGEDFFMFVDEINRVIDEPSKMYAGQHRQVFGHSPEDTSFIAKMMSEKYGENRNKQDLRALAFQIAFRHVLLDRATEKTKALTDSDTILVNRLIESQRRKYDFENCFFIQNGKHNFENVLPNFDNVIWEKVLEKINAKRTKNNRLTFDYFNSILYPRQSYVLDPEFYEPITVKDLIRKYGLTRNEIREMFDKALCITEDTIIKKIVNNKLLDNNKIRTSYDASYYRLKNWKK